MVYYLTDENGALFYLLPNRSYTVGRKDSDIIICDQGISRKHAVIVVKADEVTVMDIGSTHGTFIDNKKLRAKQPSLLKEGNTIKFGPLIGTRIFHELPLQVTTSGIRSDQKLKLKTEISLLGGSLIPDWTERCTHVTVREILLTTKVLSAVIAGVPIVSLKFWSDFIAVVKNNQPAPDPQKYKPKCSETLLNSNLNLEYNEERKRLFKDKIFVFPLKSDKNRMASLIELAGGQSISWEENPLPFGSLQEEDLKKYVIIQTASNAEKPDKALLNFTNEYTQTGHRTVLLQEIALAIISCSCEKDCNPKFNRVASVFSKSSPKEESENVLAMPSLDVCSAMEDTKTQLVISQTCDLTTKIEIVDESLPKMEDSVVGSSEPLEVITVSSTLKRSSEADYESSFKKPRVDKNLPSKSESPPAVQQGKSLFAFKHENIAKPAASSSTYINPFAKKRKAQDDASNRPKKPTFVGNTSVSTQNTTTLVANPFASILRSKRCPTSDNVPVAKSQTNSLEIQYSAVPVVDSDQEKSFKWITKSDRSQFGTMDTSEDAEMEDRELTMFINSFKNSVVVEEEDLVVRRPGECGVDEFSGGSPVKNFKKFKKIRPRKYQTTIVPDSSYVSIVCNQRSES